MKEAIWGVLASKVGSLTDQMLRAVAGGRDRWAWAWLRSACAWRTSTMRLVLAVEKDQVMARTSA